MRQREGGGGKGNGGRERLWGVKYIDDGCSFLGDYFHLIVLLFLVMFNSLFPSVSYPPCCAYFFPVSCVVSFCWQSFFMFSPPLLFRLCGS